VSKILIVYYSRSGNTKEMAESIAKGARAVGNVEVVVKTVQDAEVDELLEAGAVIIGSPTYYGSMASEIKRFIDDSIRLHGKLEGKVGGAFSSSGAMGGGNETTVMCILGSLLIHGMIVQGSSKGAHYGPVAVGKPDAVSKSVCEEYGKRIARLVLKMHPDRRAEQTD